MARKHPSVVVLAGPNGAGKSTAAPGLLKGALGVDEFVNADVIARGLSAFAPERVAISAGRIMLRRIHDLAEKRANFAFETTLASRSFAPWLVGLRKRGYQIQLVFLWLPSADFALNRVRDRIAHGGHSVPPDVVQRRYAAGLCNLPIIYQPVCDHWRIYDNTVEPHLIAMGTGGQTNRIYDRECWQKVLKSISDAKEATQKH